MGWKWRLYGLESGSMAWLSIWRYFTVSPSRGADAQIYEECDELLQYPGLSNRAQYLCSYL